MGLCAGKRGGARTLKFYQDVSAELCDAVKIAAKYDVAYQDGETRRERNERFGLGELSPEIELPDIATNMWFWFWELDRTRPNSSEGLPHLMNQEFIAWLELSGEHVTREEWHVLCEIDDAFCQASNKEVMEIRKAMDS